MQVPLAFLARTNCAQEGREQSWSAKYGKVSDGILYTVFLTLFFAIWLHLFHAEGQHCKPSTYNMCIYSYDRHYFQHYFVIMRRSLTIL